MHVFCIGKVDNTGVRMYTCIFALARVTTLAYVQECQRWRTYVCMYSCIGKSDNAGVRMYACVFASGKNDNAGVHIYACILALARVTTLAYVQERQRWRTYVGMYFCIGTTDNAGVRMYGCVSASGKNDNAGVRMYASLVALARMTTLAYVQE